LIAWMGTTHRRRGRIVMSFVIENCNGAFGPKPSGLVMRLINGVIKETLNRTEFLARIHNVQLPSNFSKQNGGEPQNVEVAIRIHGCGAQRVLGFTHAYWA